jgi:hypothetical protein
MGIYKNILKGKVAFPSIFDKEAKDAKSLIRHLLVADLSKRYGNLKDGTHCPTQVQTISRNTGGSTHSIGMS